MCETSDDRKGANGDFVAWWRMKRGALPVFPFVSINSVYYGGPEVAMENK